jgi:hypothetical protein
MPTIELVVGENLGSGPGVWDFLLLGILLVESALLECLSQRDIARHRFKGALILNVLPSPQEKFDSDYFGLSEECPTLRKVSDHKHWLSMSPAFK